MTTGRQRRVVGTHARRGTAIVELAIVLPLLLLLLLGIMEVGHLMFVRYNMVNAATQGARVGIVVPDATEDLIISRVQDALENSGVGHYPMDISAEVTPPPDNVVTVTVSVPYIDVAIFGGFMSESLVLSSTCTNYK